MLYAFLKTLHLIGVVMLVGNAVVTLIWKLAADRTRHSSLIAFAQRLVILTDWWFTVGGVILLMLGGYGAAAVAHLDLVRIAWLLWGQVLLVVSGALWAGVLVPAQIQQVRQARAFAEGRPIPEGYWQAGRRWTIWGILATALLVVAIALMVFKPL